MTTNPLIISIIDIDALEATDEVQTTINAYTNGSAAIPTELQDQFTLPQNQCVDDELQPHISIDAEPTLIDLLIKKELIPNWKWLLEDAAEGSAWITCTEQNVSILVSIDVSDTQ